MLGSRFAGPRRQLPARLLRLRRGRDGSGFRVSLQRREHCGRNRYAGVCRAQGLQQ